tara:strand:+ start:563 stop:1960 length:1398 start_codon:yes stop_codon:yes gene_type:complete
MKNINFLGLNAEYWLFLLSFFVCLAVLLFSNFSTSYLIGDESYLHLRLMGDTGYDDLSYGGREISYPVGFGFLIGLLSPLLGGVFAVKLLHFIFGMFTFVLFFFILRKLGFMREDRLYALFFLILSPAFIYLFSFSGSFSVAVFLTLLSFLLLLHKKLLVGSLVFFLIPFFNLYAGFFGLFLLFFYVFEDKKRISWFLMMFLGVVLLSFLLYGDPIVYREPVQFVDLVSDFGGDFGFAFFTLILAFLGFIVLWTHKYHYFFFYLLFGFLVFFMLFYTWVLFYFSFFIAIVAAIGFKDFLDRKWESPLVKYFTLLLLLLGVVFSGLSYLERVDEVGPTPQTVKTLETLENLPHYEGEIIFSHIDGGNWVAYYTGRKNFVDTNYLNAPNVYTRLEDHDTILYSGKHNVVNDILKGENVRYIFLDEKIIEELLDKGGVGILRVFNLDPETYTLIYDGETEQIWGVNYD